MKNVIKISVVLKLRDKIEIKVKMPVNMYRNILITPHETLLGLKLDNYILNHTRTSKTIQDKKIKTYLGKEYLTITYHYPYNTYYQHTILIQDLFYKINSIYFNNTKRYPEIELNQIVKGD